jgi:uncharacterized protein
MLSTESTTTISTTVTATALIACGPLLSEDGAQWRGTAILAELPNRSAADALIAQEPYAQAGLYERIEVYDWRFGGRPQT